MNQENIIDFSNEESVIFSTVSTAINYIVDMLCSEIHAVGIHCSDTEDTKHLQNYIAGLYKSII